MSTENKLKTSSIFVQWSQNISSEVSEAFINKMTNEEFSLFLKCELPTKYLIPMSNNMPFIGDEKRLILINQIKLSRSLNRI